MRLIVHNHFRPGVRVTRDVGGYSRSYSELGSLITKFDQGKITRSQLFQKAKEIGFSTAEVRVQIDDPSGGSFGGSSDAKRKLTHDCGSDCECDDCSGAKDAQPADYFKRVDEHLKTLSSPELKKKFLRDQFEMFEKRYNDFQRKGGKGGPNESAFNYTETLAHLQQLMGQL